MCERERKSERERESERVCVWAREGIGVPSMVRDHPPSPGRHRHTDCLGRTRKGERDMGMRDETSHHTAQLSEFGRYETVKA